MVTRLDWTSLQANFCVSALVITLPENIVPQANSSPGQRVIILISKWSPKLLEQFTPLPVLSLVSIPTPFLHRKDKCGRHNLWGSQQELWSSHWLDPQFLCVNLHFHSHLMWVKITFRGELTVPHFKTHYKATVFKIMLYWPKDRRIAQWNRLERPEMSPHIYSQMIRVPRPLNGMASLFNNGGGQTGYPNSKQ